MKTKDKGTENIRIVIRSDVAMQLKEHALNKYGRTYGTLSIICQEAIVQYLASQEDNTYTQERCVKTPEENKKTFQEMPDSSKPNDNSVLYSDSGDNNGKRTKSFQTLREIATLIKESGLNKSSQLYPKNVQNIIKNVAGLNCGTVNQYYNALKPYFVYSVEGDSFGVDLEKMMGEGLL